MPKEPTYLVTEDVFYAMLPYVQPKVEEVSNQKELLAIPWVKSFTKHNKFARYTISPHEDEGFKYLMIEDADCRWWWPVAKLPLDFPTNLPKFKSVLDKTIIQEENEELQEVPKSNSRKKK